MTIGEKIRTARQNKKMTLRDLGEKLGVSFVYVGQIERGERTLTTPKLKEWGEVLGINLLEEATSKEIEKSTLEIFKNIANKTVIEDILKLIDKKDVVLTENEVMELWFKVEALVKFELYKMNK